MLFHEVIAFIDMDNCNINRWQQLKGQLNNLSPEAFRDAMESIPEAVILDCRTPEEFTFSRIKNAVNFNYLSENFVEEMDNLNPNTTYLIYCRSERRSLRTCTLLTNGGFDKVFNLDGGLKNWVSVFGEDSLVRPL